MPASSDWITSWLNKPRQGLCLISFWASLWLIYIVIFVLLFQVIERSALVINLLLVFVYTLKYRLCGGLLVVLMLIPLHLLGVYWMGGLEVLQGVAEKYWTAQVGLALFTYMLAWAFEMRRRVQQELTHAQRLQEQLLIEKNRAIDANKAKDDLLATISHDLRTPVSGIIQSAQLLHHELPSNTREQIIGNIGTSGQQLLHVVNDLLDLYRQDAQTLVETAESFNLNEQISDIVRLTQPLFETQNLMLEYSIDSNIPAQISGYPKLLRQTLFNLLGNSLKYTQQGGVIIKTSVNNTVDALIITVSDTGSGIAEEDLPAILDNSYRHSRVTFGSDKPGYGLGLSNCSKMVTIMKGELAITSTLGEGTTITLSLPLVLAQLEPAVKTQVVSETAAITPKPGKRVLLIEDDEVLIVSLQEMLKLLGCEVSIARDGVQALQVTGQGFDLILVDRHLPDGCSDNMLSTLRDIHRYKDYSICIVLLTADVVTLIDTEDWLALDADLVLTKPINLNELRRLLNWSDTEKTESETADTELTLDRGFLQSERNLLGKVVVNRLQETFLAEAPDYLRRCLMEFGKQNYQRCALYVHKLRGAARSVGLPLLAQQAGNIEQMCLQQDRIRLFPQLTRLQRCFQRSVLALQDNIDSSDEIITDLSGPQNHAD